MQFTKDLKNLDGLCARCIQCRAHERRLAQYDLSAQEYLRMGFSQNWECAICRAPQSELEQGLVVDHDHVTGTVRMLLCTGCNIGLGHFADDVVRMRRAAEYIELWSKQNVEA